MIMDLKISNNVNPLTEFKNHLNNKDKKQLFNILYKDSTFLLDLNKPLPKNNRIYKHHRFFLYR